MSRKNSKVRLCTFCKHPYIEPCDGKSAKCGNKLYIEREAPRNKKKGSK